MRGNLSARGDSGFCFGIIQIAHAARRFLMMSDPIPPGSPLPVQTVLDYASPGGKAYLMLKPAEWAVVFLLRRVVADFDFLARGVYGNARRRTPPASGRDKRGLMRDGS